MLHDVFDLMDKISEGCDLGKMKVHECCGNPDYIVHTMSLNDESVVPSDSGRFIILSMSLIDCDKVDRLILR